MSPCSLRLLSHTNAHNPSQPSSPPPPQKQRKLSERSPSRRLDVIRTRTTGPAIAAARQEQDTTALEIAASDALFGQTDEPWALPSTWGDAANWHPTATSAPTSTNHNPRKTGKAKGEFMGNFDRHHRGAQVAGMSHQLPRMKASGNASTSAPYLHQFLERGGSANSSTNSLLFSAGDATTKRPRPSNSSSFLAPSFGFPSSPPLEADHPLPDFNNWGFGGRNGTRTSSGVALSSSSASHGHSISTSSLAAIGSGLSSPNGASMFAGVDSFLPDYDASLDSLWPAPSGGSVMDYGNDTAQDQHAQVQPPLYMASDDELKMDYPQLTEFNQDLDSYLNDTMETGGPSPTTPLETSAANSMMKVDHLVTTDRRTGSGVGAGLGSSVMTTGNREPQLDRLLAPAAATATAEYLVKRGRETTGSENTSERSLKRSRGGYGDACGVAPISSGTLTGFTPSSSANIFRSAPKSTVIEPKRAIPPLGSFHSGPPPLMLTSAASSQAGIASSGVATTTTVVTSTITAFDATKAGKRPRSRQCEFPGCQNRARSHQKCKKHGGAHQCVFEGCTKNSQSRGLCIAHGGGSRCKREGCVRAAQSKGLCKSHGGGEFCAVEGCNKKAHLKHLCRTHGGGVRCKVDKCLKWAQRKGWCMAHAKEFAAT